MFAPAQPIETEVFARVPDALRKTDPNHPWFAHRPFAAPHSFLEGPAFDHAGNLYCVDIPYGRVFKVSPAGEFSVIAEYDGEPNGLRMHNDGRIFICDRARGLLLLDPARGAVTTVTQGPEGRGFRGLNDLNFAPNGDLYFTDQGDDGLENPTGAVYCLRGDGRLDLILDRLPGPNGLAVSADGRMLYVNVSRANAVWSVPLNADGTAKRVNAFLQLSGSTGGPDGLALDIEGGLAVAHSGLGSVWLFSKDGEPRYRVRSCAGMRTTNLAYGGEGGRSLFITESASGSILRAQMPVAGQPLFSHATTR